MKKILHYGMVGGGPGAFIGDAHRRAIALDGKAQLAAGCFSRDPGKSRITGEELRLEPSRCYADYRQMALQEAARENGIDFVVVVTPNASHYEICKTFLQAGIAVVCDKPLTITYAQAAELQTLAKEKDLLFMVTYTYIGYAMAKFARALIRSGEIGDVRMVMAEYPQNWLASENSDGGKQGWRCDPKLSGGVNCLGDIGTHIENLVSSMTGLKIRRLLAKMDVIVPGRVLDDNDSVLVEFNNGASGMFWSSQIAFGSDNGLRIRIYGSKGAIHWFQETPERLKIIGEDNVIRELHLGSPLMTPDSAAYCRMPAGHPEGWFGALGNLYCSYTRCLQAKMEGSFIPDMIDFPTVDEGAEGLAFIEACLESNRKGNIWVEIK